MRAILLGAALVFVSAAVAGAGECPMRQAQIDTRFGKRFDRQATDAKAKAAEAMALHKAGKHEESVKAYEEAAKMGAVQLTRK
jgi:hypothetical protein